MPKTSKGQQSLLRGCYNMRERKAEEKPRKSRGKAAEKPRKSRGKAAEKPWKSRGESINLMFDLLYLDVS